MTPPNGAGKNSLMVHEMGQGVANQLKSYSLLTHINFLLASISHLHNDHTSNIKEVEALCHEAGVPMLFLDYYNHNGGPYAQDSHKLYRGLQDLGIQRPNMITPREGATMMGLRNIENTRLVHAEGFHSFALAMEDDTNELQRITTILPDNCDVKGSKRFFKGDLAGPMLKQNFFDVTGERQHRRNFHLSIDTVKGYNVYEDEKGKHCAWHMYTNTQGSKNHDLSQQLMDNGFDIFYRHMYKGSRHLNELNKPIKNPEKSGPQIGESA